MNWHDWVTLVIMVTVIVVQTIRGSKAAAGLPMFEAAGGVVAAAAATAFSPGLAGAIHVREDTVMFVLFIVFLAVAFMLAHWLFAMTGLSFQSLDGIFSFFFGLVLAWAVAHMFLRIMIGSAEGESAQAIANSPVAREVFRFRSWSALLRLLFKAKTGPDFDPTEG
jgi:positive regulator of sigma E activity